MNRFGHSDLSSLWLEWKYVYMFVHVKRNSTESLWNRLMMCIHISNMNMNIFSLEYHVRDVDVYVCVFGTNFKPLLPSFIYFAVDVLLCINKLNPLSQNMKIFNRIERRKGTKIVFCECVESQLNGPNVITKIINSLNRVKHIFCFCLSRTTTMTTTIKTIHRTMAVALCEIECDAIRFCLLWT